MPAHQRQRQRQRTDLAGPPAVPTPVADDHLTGLQRGDRPAPVPARDTPIPRGRATDPPGRPDPLVVNLPAATVDSGHPQDPRPQPDAPDLRLPHERDQSGVDATAATPDPVVAQAARDLEVGLVDTDLRNPDGIDGPRRRRLIRQQR